MRAWHRLRFAQRHLLMSSHGAVGRLITLTGRMSVYRGAVATDPAFIDIDPATTASTTGGSAACRLLTGEDKSAAYWLLRRGLRDALRAGRAGGDDRAPAVARLLRASTRADAALVRQHAARQRARLALGPAAGRLFVWWCLVDQRISMWTPLVGPIDGDLLSDRRQPGVPLRLPGLGDAHPAAAERWRC